MPIVKFPPLTVEKAVDYLQANMSLNYEIPLTTMNKENLFSLHFSLGAYARDILGLWSGNEALIESCRLAAGNKELDVDDASMLIISLLWERLQNKDNLGLAGGEKLDAKKELVSFDELLMSEVIQSEALINLRDRKGIISKRELLEEMKRVKASLPKSSQ